MLTDGATVQQLVEWSAQPVVLPRRTIGDWRGKPWSEGDEGLLHWICDHDKDFDETIIRSVKYEFARRRRSGSLSERARPVQFRQIEKNA